MGPQTLLEQPTTSGAEKSRVSLSERGYDSFNFRLTPAVSKYPTAHAPLAVGRFYEKIVSITGSEELAQLRYGFQVHTRQTA